MKVNRKKLTAIFVIVILMMVQSRKKLKIPDNIIFKMDEKFIKMPNSIFCYNFTHRHQKSFRLKFALLNVV